MEKLINAIQQEIELLETWARESKLYGWSTHQTQPQLDRARQLKELLYDTTKNLKQ